MIEPTIRYSKFKSEIMKPSYQTRNVLRFVRWRYKWGKLIRTISMNILIETLQSTMLRRRGRDRSRCTRSGQTTLQILLWIASKISRNIAEAFFQTWQQYSMHLSITVLYVSKIYPGEEKFLAWNFGPI